MGAAVRQSRVLGTSKETEKEWSDRSKKRQREQRKTKETF